MGVVEHTSCSQITSWPLNHYWTYTVILSPSLLIHQLKPGEIIFFLQYILLFPILWPKYWLSGIKTECRCANTARANRNHFWQKSSVVCMHNGGRIYGSPSYLAYHLKNVMIFHLLSISLLNDIFDILSPNLYGVRTWIVITFYEPSLTKFIYYKNRFIPNPLLINPLYACPILIWR